MGLSKNSGTPTWMVKIMENSIKMDDWGGYHHLRKHPYIYLTSNLHLSHRVAFFSRWVFGLLFLITEACHETCGMTMATKKWPILYDLEAFWRLEKPFLSILSMWIVCTLSWNLAVYCTINAQRCFCWIILSNNHHHHHHHHPCLN